ncbi:MAG: signal peptidase I [Oscillospiraceae bacterium]|nr:signal peptidase I [Oscillospiraceae bacterium]
MEQSEQEKNMQETTGQQEQTPQETPAEPSGENTGAQEATDPGSEEPDGVIDGKALFSDVMDILETMLASVFVVLLLFGYFMRPVTVQGRSMVPTLHDQDRLVMFRMLYQPKRGDIVVVNNYEGHTLDADGNIVPNPGLDENIIKRVIALGGQTITVDASAGEVWVDGEKLDEPYINELTLTNDRAFEYPLTIPEGYIFVMGDNRNHSTDSRSSRVGLVKKEDVLGRAYFRYVCAEPDENDPSEKGTFGFVK